MDADTGSLDLFVPCTPQSAVLSSDAGGLGVAVQSPPDRSQLAWLWLSHTSRGDDATDTFD